MQWEDLARLLNALDRIADALETIAYGPKTPPDPSDDPPF